MCWKNVKIGRICVGKMSKLDEYVLEKCIFPRLFLIKHHFIIVEIKHPQRCVAEDVMLRLRRCNVRHIKTQRQVSAIPTLRLKIQKIVSEKSS